MPHSKNSEGCRIGTLRFLIAPFPKQRIVHLRQSSPKHSSAEEFGNDRQYVEKDREK